MKNEYQIRNIIRCVLWGTLIVVVLSACGKSTSAYLEAEQGSECSTQLQTESQMQDTQQEEAVVSKDNQALSEAESSAKGDKLIYVYICGSVKNAGVYALPEGSRLIDLFHKAGGLTKQAAMEYWNQAQILEDGQMYYVPTKEEAKAYQISVSDQYEGAQNSDVSDEKININTASKEQLMQIPGIGEAKAQAILAYREREGAFSCIEDVMQVEGIKDGVFEKIKNYIKV